MMDRLIRTTPEMAMAIRRKHRALDVWHRVAHRLETMPEYQRGGFMGLSSFLTYWMRAIEARCENAPNQGR